MNTEEATANALVVRNQQKQLAVIENQLDIPLNRLFSRVTDRLRNPNSSETDEFVLEIENLVNIFFEKIRKKLQAPLNQELESMERDVKSLQPNLLEKGGLFLFAAGGVVMTYSNLMEATELENYGAKDACKPDTVKGKSYWKQYIYDGDCGGTGFVDTFVKGPSNQALKLPAEAAKIALPLISCCVTLAGYHLYQASKKDIKKFDNARTTYRSEVETIIDNNITRLRNSLIQELQIMPQMFGAALASLISTKLRNGEFKDEAKVNQVLQETVRDIINYGETMVEQMTTHGLVLEESDIAALAQSRHKMIMVVGNYGLEYKQAYSQVLAQSTSGVKAVGSLGTGFFSAAAGAATSVAKGVATTAMGAALFGKSKGKKGNRTKKKRRN